VTVRGTVLSCKRTVDSHYRINIYPVEAKPFEIKKNERVAISAEDPFSKDRNLKVKQGHFQVKKSDKPTTQFVDVNVPERERKVFYRLHLSIFYFLYLIVLLGHPIQQTS